MSYTLGSVKAANSESALKKARQKYKKEHNGKYYTVTKVKKFRPEMTIKKNFKWKQGSGYPSNTYMVYGRLRK